MGYEHKPVLLDEVIEALAIRANGFYIDATFGRGGHSRAILQRLGREGQLLAFDKDPTAINSIATDVVSDPRFAIVQGSFTMLMQQVEKRKMTGKVAGILFDFGVSSPQLDDPHRGFSFRHDAPLDMRMDPTSGMPVSEWLNMADEKEIADVIYQYGEERASRRIARAIVNDREQQPFTHTRQLADLIQRLLPGKKHDIHPATRTFQALRIFINHELEDIEQVLPQAVTALAKGGRLAAISFHSLEDRIVKRFIRDASRPPSVPIAIPVMPDDSQVSLKPVGKKQRASTQEISNNPRARSAVLRVAEKLS